MQPNAVFHPNTLEPLKGERAIFIVTVILRALFFIVLVYILDGALDLGTAPLVLSLAVTVGVLAGSRLAGTTLNNLGFFVLLLAGCLILKLSFSILALLPVGADYIFTPFRTELHVNLICLAVLVGAVSTWFFWRVQAVISLEALIIGFLCVELLAGHRNYHFEVPKVVNTLAWNLGFDYLTMFVILGVAAAILLLTYLAVASLAGRRLWILHAERTSLVWRTVILGGIALLLFTVSTLVHRHYALQVLTRTANGVGQERSTGLTPLGFHSALGSTNEPAALVRLEGDYPGNPFTPMLYLRESALSQFNGRELVIADKTFDRDVNNSMPEEPFDGVEDAEIENRTPITQSIYLLTEHKNAFALDYPLTIRQLKNPNQGRFKQSYRVYSMAPSFTLSELNNEEIGDPRWSEREKAHYLATHPDPRYNQMAQKVTADVERPIEKALAITNFLSRTAIYTLTPNHEVKENEDPVAPFLFGDMRGYCVHFAHAMVYLFRAVGIPARIGTGYLTDLSQAKDGHSLLRMSDRHAWAEIFIKGKGWVPFDVQPDQVESHAETQVDMKILEELMGLLDPGEEILPKDVATDEVGMESPSEFFTPRAKHLALVFCAVVALMAVLKIFLRWAWLLPLAPSVKLRLMYLALGSGLYDLGLRRGQGETLGEFRARLKKFNLSTLELAESLGTAKYAPDGLNRLDWADVSKQFSTDRAALRSFGLTRRFMSWLNPSSTMAFISKGRF